VSHESADKATTHGNQNPAVDYFYSAATRRSRDALWTIFAPAFSLLPDPAGRKPDKPWGGVCVLENCGPALTN
jgi:hypothetical protein